MISHQTPPKEDDEDRYTYFFSLPRYFLSTFIYLFQIGKVVRLDSLTRPDPAAAQHFKLTYQFTMYL